MVAIDLGVDTSSPTGEMVANVMMAVRQCERRTIGQRTSDTMQPAKRQRRRVGRRSVLPEATATRLLKLRTSHTLAATADALNAEGLHHGYLRLLERAPSLQDSTPTHSRRDRSPPPRGHASCLTPRRSDASASL